MEEYIGKVCPYCKEEIKEGDSVIVCPDCGSYYHDNCWKQNSSCILCNHSERSSDENRDKEPSAEEHVEGAIGVCANCGAHLEEDDDFCPKCGTPKDGIIRRVCSNCGVELKDGQDFCTKCGTKYNPNGLFGANTRVNEKHNKRNQKNKLKKILIPIIAVALLAAIGAVLFFVLRGTPVSKVELKDNTVTITEGKTTKLLCTVTPADAKDKTLAWTSSNTKIATVDNDGSVKAIAEGTCTITVSSSNGKTDACTIVVKSAGPDFSSLYNRYCSSVYATVGSDGSYLNIDTNPYDIDDYTASGSIEAIINVNKAIGLPDYIIDEMGNTTALMGKQSETFSDLGVTVNWSYHPNSGLDVTYRLINE